VPTMLHAPPVPRQGWTWPDLLEHQFRYGLALRPRSVDASDDSLTQIITAYRAHTGDAVIPLLHLRTWADIHLDGLEAHLGLSRKDRCARQREVDRWVLMALSDLPTHVTVRRLARSVGEE